MWGHLVSLDLTLASASVQFSLQWLSGTQRVLSLCRANKQSVIEEHAVQTAGNYFVSVLKKEVVCVLYLVNNASAPRVVF